MGSVWLGLLLSGCASTLSTQVTRFHAWSPELAQSSFAFVRPVDPSRELEQASYEAAVAAELHRLGLQPAYHAPLCCVSAPLLTHPVRRRPR